MQACTTDSLALRLARPLAWLASHRVRNPALQVISGSACPRPWGTYVRAYRQQEVPGPQGLHPRRSTARQNGPDRLEARRARRRRVAHRQRVGHQRHQPHQRHWRLLRVGVTAPGRRTDPGGRRLLPMADAGASQARRRRDLRAGACSSSTRSPSGGAYGRATPEGPSGLTCPSGPAPGEPVTAPPAYPSPSCALRRTRTHGDRPRLPGPVLPRAGCRDRSAGTLALGRSGCANPAAEVAAVRTMRQTPAGAAQPTDHQHGGTRR